MSVTIDTSNLRDFPPNPDNLSPAIAWIVGQVVTPVQWARIMFTAQTSVNQHLKRPTMISIGK